MEQERHGKKRRFHEFLENYYELSKNGTDVKTEIIAGMTTFLTMAYVLAVIPGFLKEEKKYMHLMLAVTIARFWIMMLHLLMRVKIRNSNGNQHFIQQTVIL